MQAVNITRLYNAAKLKVLASQNYENAKREILKNLDNNLEDKQIIIEEL